jgi:hypothetical protein
LARIFGPKWKRIQGVADSASAIIPARKEAHWCDEMTGRGEVRDEGEGCRNEEEARRKGQNGVQ